MKIPPYNKFHAGLNYCNIIVFFCESFIYIINFSRYFINITLFVDLIVSQATLTFVQFSTNDFYIPDSLFEVTRNLSIGMMLISQGSVQTRSGL